MPAEQRTTPGTQLAPRKPRLLSLWAPLLNLAELMCLWEMVALSVCSSVEVYVGSVCVGGLMGAVILRPVPSSSSGPYPVLGGVGTPSGARLQPTLQKQF